MPTAVESDEEALKLVRPLDVDSAETAFWIDDTCDVRVDICVALVCSADCLACSSWRGTDAWFISAVTTELKSMLLKPLNVMGEDTRQFSLPQPFSQNRAIRLRSCFRYATQELRRDGRPPYAGAARLPSDRRLTGAATGRPGWSGS